MANKQDYLDSLRAVIGKLHHCGATWQDTVPVQEVFQGKTIWQGNAEVFDLTGHPKSKRPCAWSHPDGEHDERTRFVAVLEIPPVESPETAGKVAIATEVKGKK